MSATGTKHQQPTTTPINNKGLITAPGAVLNTVGIPDSILLKTSLLNCD